MHIFVLSTGGTIGSAAENGVISPEAGQEMTLLQMYRESYTDKVQFTVCRVCDILSENADDTFYELLISKLRAIPSGADGVIVLHGTDTLSYTAALCAMACGGACKVPVGFVSSAYVLSDVRQNGVCNFRAAVRYIECGGMGFFVPYRNTDGSVQIHLATRVMEADAFSADFQSAKKQVLARVTADGTVQFSGAPDLPSCAQLSNVQETAGLQNLRFQKSVLPLKLYPNLDFSAILPNRESCAAVLLIGYHSGTAPVCALSAFAKRMQAQKIPLYLAPIPRAAALYESTRELLEIGVIPIFSRTAESALAKLKLAYNQTACPPEAFLQKESYFEEVT